MSVRLAALACVAALAAAGCSREGADRTPDGGKRPAAAANTKAPAGGSPASPSAAAYTPETPGPAGDAFFDPPSPLPALKPGDVIRYRPFDVPKAFMDGAAKQTVIMYATTGYDGKPAAATGILHLPPGPAPAGGRPVVTTNHGTTGEAPLCGPSRGWWVNTGIFDNEPDYESLMESLLKRGFAVVEPDYLGLGATGTQHAYLYGKSAAYSTIDLIRAARNLEPEVGKTTFFTGGSQGGHAALFSAHYAPEYAPELDVKGVIAEAPAVGMDFMADMIASGSDTTKPYVGIFLALVRGADIGEHDSVKIEQFLTPDAVAYTRTPPSNEQCAQGHGEPPAPDNVLLPGADLGPINAYLKANATSSVKLKVPVLLAQGGKDILSPMNLAMAQGLCANGMSVEFKPYPEGSHTLGGLLTEDGTTWIMARLNGEPPTNACTF